MTNQEILNKVTEHLLKQNAKSMRNIAYGHRVCAYRGNNDTRCAIGCLIPDELYSRSIEGIPVCDLSPNYMPEVSHEPGTSALLYKLQVIHDQLTPIEWPKALLKAAKDFKLEVPPVLARAPKRTIGRPRKAQAKSAVK